MDLKYRDIGVNLMGKQFAAYRDKTAENIAEIRGTGTKEVPRITLDNTKDFFHP